MVMFGSFEALNETEDAFKKDYIEMLVKLKEVNSQKIIVVIPPPIYEENQDSIGDARAKFVNENLPNLIAEITKEAQIPECNVVDMFSQMGGIGLLAGPLMSDGVHPNDDGYELIAR